MPRTSGPDARLIRVLAAPSGAQANANPYLSSLYRHTRSHGVEITEFTRSAAIRGADVIHLHWPELLIAWDRGGLYAAWDAGKVLGVLVVAKLRGAALVWTGHNLEPHDVPQPWVFTAYWAVLSRLLDHVITLNGAAGQRLVRRYPWLRRVPMSVIRHGDYLLEYPPTTVPMSASAQLGITVARGPTVLAFGQLRRYKRFDELLESFLAAGAPGHLVIAGSPSRAVQLAAQMEAQAGSNSAVTLRLHYLEPAEVSLLHSVADVVVLPYDQASALNSGSALLALSLGRRVVLPTSCPHEELSALVGPGWIHQVDGGLPELLARALEVGAEPAPANGPDLSAMAWEHIGLQTAHLFRQLAGQRGDNRIARAVRGRRATEKDRSSRAG